MASSQRYPFRSFCCLSPARSGGADRKPRRVKRPGGRNAGAMSIVPEVVGKGDIGVNLNALAPVTSLATVTVRTQVSGQLINVVFKEGARGQEG